MRISFPRQELADDVADDRRAAQPAADGDPEADGAIVRVHRLQPDVVDEDRRAVVGRPGDCDLELAGQEGELRVQRRPLPHQLAVGAGVDDLVAGDAGEVVGRDVADAVARRLDRVHFHRRQFGKDVGNARERRPVELQVLSRGEVAVAAVVGPRDVRERTQLPRRQQSVRNRDPQHRRVLLHVQAVLQTQRPELVVGEFAREIPAGLVAELGDALGDEAMVEVVVAVHGGSGAAAPRRGVSLCANAKHTGASL